MRIKRVSRGRRTSDDGVFDSAGELGRWTQLKLLERAGEISELRRQVKFPLEINGVPVLLRSPRYPAGRRCGYSADFVYRERGSPVLTIEDYKGILVSEARLRIAVAEAIYGFQVKITGPADIPRRRVTVVRRAFAQLR